MANWDLSINTPAIGGDYVVTVQKPANAMRVADTANCNTVLPPGEFYLHYVSGSGPGSSARPENWLLGRTRGTSAATRSVEITVYLDGVKKKKISATIMDSSGGGPPRRR